MSINLNIKCFTSFLNNLQNAIILVNGRGEIQFLNDFFIHSIGFNRFELPTIKLFKSKVLKNGNQIRIFEKLWDNSINDISKDNASCNKDFTITCKNKILKKSNIHIDKFNNDLWGITFTVFSEVKTIPEETNNPENHLLKYSPYHKIPDNYYKQIVNLANVAIVRFDKDFIITDFTGNSEHIFRFSRSEVIGKSLYDTIVPNIESTGKDLKKMLNDLILRIKSYEYNINENTRKIGDRIWMQWHNTEIKDNNNNFLEVLSISYSIIQEHDGKIKVKSVPKLGTEIIIQLPIIQK